MPGGGRYLTLDRLLQIKALMQSLVISEYSVHSKCIFLKRKGKRRILYKNDILQTSKKHANGLDSCLVRSRDEFFRVQLRIHHWYTRLHMAQHNVTEPLPHVNTAGATVWTWQPNLCQTAADVLTCQQRRWFENEKNSILALDFTSLVPLGICRDKCCCIYIINSLYIKMVQATEKNDLKFDNIWCFKCYTKSTGNVHLKKYWQYRNWLCVSFSSHSTNPCFRLTGLL